MAEKSAHKKKVSPSSHRIYNGYGMLGSKAKFSHAHLSDKRFSTMEQKYVVLCIVKQEYFVDSSGTFYRSSAVAQNLNNHLQVCQMHVYKSLLFFIFALLINAVQIMLSFLLIPKYSIFQGRFGPPGIKGKRGESGAKVSSIV